MIFNFVTIIIISYLVAAINPSIFISKRVLKKDIRELGSKNAGTTNAIRTMGKAMGALVFVLDLLKVVVSYGLIHLIGVIFKEEVTSTVKTLYMLFSVIGHSYPIYYGFKGGKGVAVFLMSAILVDYKMALICIALGVVVILISRMVSLGSIVGSIAVIILDIFMATSYDFWILILVVAIVVYNHRANIQRIIDGNENKLF